MFFISINRKIAKLSNKRRLELFFALKGFMAPEDLNKQDVKLFRKLQKTKKLPKALDTRNIFPEYMQGVFEE